MNGKNSEIVERCEIERINQTFKVVSFLYYITINHINNRFS